MSGGTLEGVLRGLVLALVLLAGASAGRAQDAGRLDTASADLARTPPMGWNSWNRFGCDIDEQVVRQVADAMVSSGMRELEGRRVGADRAAALRAKHAMEGRQRIDGEGLGVHLLVVGDDLAPCAYGPEDAAMRGVQQAQAQPVPGAMSGLGVARVGCEARLRAREGP